MPNSELMKELRWYLETFLDYPFSPFTERAERIQSALEHWGTQAFEALFGDRETGRFFDAATEQDYSGLHLEISSDDPAILHWPWEALRDPEAGVLSRTCQISRRLNKVRDPHPISNDLPKDVINILLVTARPYQSDVRFRSISRPLVDLIAQHQLPATVTLLRPPTVEQLHAHLTEHPNHYHILHFDGHGSYGSSVPQHDPSTLTLKGSQGQLIFEDADGKPDPQSANVLSELLREHKISTVVLNACQSAMVDDQADDAFASVATGLQKSGVRSVVAMAYSLYVSGAQQFLPAFYRRLFQTGNVAEATRAGRQQAFLQPDRVCARGSFPLDDWLVPVLYEQQALELKFGTTTSPNPTSSLPSSPAIPEEALDRVNPYGFIGRDGQVLELERAMYRPPAAILIHGLGGIGKTTLCRGFIKWLADTNGLPAGCIWLSFQEIRSAEYVLNHLVGTLFGTNALAAPTEQKWHNVIQTLRANQVLIVWDNFEVVRGYAGESMAGTLPEADQLQLARFLQQLRGGKTKVLITSRSSEDWLESTSCFRLPIRGLAGEERWEFCNAIAKDFGLTIDRKHDDWQKLIDMLDGHPLAMRVVLSRLRETSPAQLHKGLTENLQQFAGLDAESAKLFATLRFAEDSLPADLHVWLIPLSLHERFVDVSFLKAIGKQVQELQAQAESQVDRLMSWLAFSGLISSVGKGIFELHPALSRVLYQSQTVSASSGEVAAWQRSFTDIMGKLADHFAAKKLHEQRVVFHVHGANFRRALEIAMTLQMCQHELALTQSLAAFAQNTGSYTEAIALFTRLADVARQIGDPKQQASAYHQMGVIALEQRDFATAEQWCRKSITISEKQGDERGEAATFHEMGRISEEQRDFASAEHWYRKSIGIYEKHGDNHEAASTYLQLGSIAQEQRDFATAERWYRKSLAIEEIQGNEHGAALTYHQLGRVAEEQRDFTTAEQWYRKSLAIKEKLGDEHGAAGTYHQLGTIAKEQLDLATAEKWYRKSLAIAEKLGDDHAAAITYHQLGGVAVEQGDMATAEQWCRKSLSTFEKLGDEHGAASTYHQLGSIVKEQRDFATAEKWYRKSLAIEEKHGNEYGAATTYHQLGIIAQEQHNFVTAEKWYRKSLSVFQKQGDSYGMASTSAQLGLLYLQTGKPFDAGLCFVTSLPIFEGLDPRFAAQCLRDFLISYVASTVSDKQRLQKLWQNANLGEFPTGESK